MNLNDYQFKASRYNYGSTYMNPMVTTNQKPMIDTQKPKRKEPKHRRKENHQTTMGGKKKRRNEQGRTTKNKQTKTKNWQTRNKMAISTYLSIITLHVNWTKCSNQIT